MRSLKNDKRLALTIEDSTSDAYVPLIIKGSINIDVDVDKGCTKLSRDTFNIKVYKTIDVDV